MRAGTIVGSVTPLGPAFPQGQEKTLWKGFPVSGLPRAVEETRACGYSELLIAEEVIMMGRKWASWCFTSSGISAWASQLISPSLGRSALVVGVQETPSLPSSHSQ